jgi:DNA-binding MarR family transcriptional regulator
VENSRHRAKLNAEVVLLALRWFPKSTSAELAKALYHDAAPTSNWLSKLYKAGLVTRTERTRHPSERNFGGRLANKTVYEYTAIG